MKLAFIGDIVGKPGRTAVKNCLKFYKDKYKIDFVIANCENASHGYGLTLKNAKELFSFGIDCITGGNHSFDKKEILTFINDYNILRPLNYPDEVLGEGLKIFDLLGEKLAVINLMGAFSMPLTTNPFIKIKACVKKLKQEGIKNIFIDFHAEATAEKRTLFKLLEGEVSAIVGTHTHIGTDDLAISNNTLYLTDIGLTGSRDNVIGMDEREPINRSLTGVSSKFNINDNSKAIFQMLIFELKEGKCLDAFKVKNYLNNEEIITKAFFD